MSRLVICGALSNLFVELCQIYLWSYANFDYGALSECFVELCRALYRFGTMPIVRYVDTFER